MSGGKNEELLKELRNELNSVQKLKLRATKQHRRVRNSVTETFESLIRTLKERRSYLLATLSHITGQIEAQLSQVETAINNDVTILQQMMQEKGEASEEDMGREERHRELFQSIHTNNQKRLLGRQAPDILFNIDPHFLAGAPLSGCIYRSQGVLASESISKAAIGVTHDTSEAVKLAAGPENNFYLLDARDNLIHLVGEEGEVQHTVALHKGTRLCPINQFYAHRDRFYVTSRQEGPLNVFLKNGQLEHSLSSVGSQMLADPCGMGHTSLGQLVVANTARHCILVCQQDLTNAVAIAEHSYQPHTLLPSPRYLVVDDNDCIYTISSQLNKLFVVSICGDILCEMAIGELQHPIRSLCLTPAGDILIHTCSHSRLPLMPLGSAVCLLKPGYGLIERLHLKGLSRTRLTDLCVTSGGVVVLSPEGSTQLMLLIGDRVVL